MPALLAILKIISVIWIIIVTGNFFRTTCLVIALRINQTDDEACSIKKAKSLLLLGFFTVWITAILIYHAEHLLFGKVTEYSANITYFTGIILLIITILSAVLAVVTAWGKSQNKQIYVTVFRGMVGEGFVFSIILWLTALKIS